MAAARSLTLPDWKNVQHSKALQGFHAGKVDMYEMSHSHITTEIIHYLFVCL